MRLITRRSTRAAAAATALAVCLTGVASAAAGQPSDGAAGKVLAGVTTSQVGAVTGSEIIFTGHGWGHGRGMGQYGALGYAVNAGWSYGKILGHYYSNTTAGSVGNPVIDVELVTPSSRTWTIVAGNSLKANGVNVGGAGGFDIAVVERTGANSYQMRLGTSCETFSPTVAATFTGSVEFTVPTQSGYENLIRSCEAGDTMRAYRGSIVVSAHGAPAGITNRLLVANRVSLENYLLGVVPRESPDSWGNLGGGSGLQALKAQTVAARSYAMAGSRPSGAKTCDTTSCQVYGGAAEFGRQGTGYVLTKNLDALAPNAFRAVSETTGEVRMLSGAVARTEFSSSTGGYTAGGTFPAVVDAGDAISSNPNRTWTTAPTTKAALGQRIFGAGAGPIREIAVTARNGLGDWGGRVTQLKVVDAQGVTHTYEGGDRIRSLLGLKSDWFSISTSARAEAENVVRALYRDVLGRGVDPSGLRTWTDYVLATGSPRDLVRAIATSRERMNKLVAAQYRLALHREPEPGGLATWVGHLEAGHGVYDLQVGIYSSPEALATLGGGDVATWVGAMYESILGRAAGASEKQFWAGLVPSHGRQAVVEAIARSDEATMRRLTVYYQTFLLRGVDASGRATFLPLMTGRGDFDIPVALGSSPEYWARAQTRSY